MQTPKRVFYEILKESDDYFQFALKCGLTGHDNMFPGLYCGRKYKEYDIFLYQETAGSIFNRRMNRDDLRQIHQKMYKFRDQLVDHEKELGIRNSEGITIENHKN